MTPVLPPPVTEFVQDFPYTASPNDVMIVQGITLIVLCLAFIFLGTMINEILKRLPPK